jgi:hypothetical protein
MISREMQGFVIGALMYPMIGCAVASVVAWCALLVKLVSRDKTHVAILLFLFAPIGYVFGFLYGWGKADTLGTRRIMQVWTWSLVGAAGFLLAALVVSEVFAKYK